MRRLTRTLLMASVCALAMTGSAFALDVPAATPGIAPSGTAAPTVPVMPGTTAAGDSIKGKVDVPHDDSPCQQGCDCTQEQLALQAAEDAAKRELVAQEAAGKW